MNRAIFADRRTAGRQLAVRLHHLRQDEPLVLALPRGGVPVGFEVAQELDTPLDVLLVRKIGVPWQPELALGAVVDGADPQVLINEGLASELAVERSYITSETARQLSEIERRRRVYLGDKPPPALTGQTIIIVDDGIATGSTARAALRAVRKAGARRIVLAVPVAPEDTINQLRAEVDGIFCLLSPSPFIAVGAHYGEFPQLADADVIALLAARHQALRRSPGQTPEG